MAKVFGVSNIYISAIYRGWLLVKNSLVNIFEVNRQVPYSLGIRSEDDFEKVSTTSEEGGVRKRRGPLGVSWPDQQKDKVFGFDPVFALDL